MNDKLGPAIDKIMLWIESAGNFVSEQAPDVARQVLTYEAWSSTMWMWALAIMAGVVTIVAISAIVTGAVNSDGDTGAVGVFLTIIAIALYVGVFSSYAEVKKIELAPKLVIIEKLAKLKGE